MYIRVPCSLQATATHVQHNSSKPSRTANGKMADAQNEKKNPIGCGTLLIMHNLLSGSLKNEQLNINIPMALDGWKWEGGRITQSFIFRVSPSVPYTLPRCLVCSAMKIAGIFVSNILALPASHTRRFSFRYLAYIFHSIRPFCSARTGTRYGENASLAERTPLPPSLLPTKIGRPGRRNRQWNNHNRKDKEK